jgi:signal transduction histidine kinase
MQDNIEKLKEENIRLQKIIVVKSDLISITAHQLRTSLSAIKWILKMFADKDFGDINDEQKEYINKAFESSERMITLVTNLLTLNHADEPVIILEPEEVNIENLIEDTIVEFYGETYKKNIAVEFQEPTFTMPTIKCDKDMIRVVLEGIIENAIKYSNPEDKILITIGRNTENNTLTICIHDNGIGIKEEDKIHIFSKFFRAENAKKEETPGSGLGLFIAQNILQQHGGSISFESTENSGTTFFVTLPIS